jgi:hypothetical protein
LLIGERLLIYGIFFYITSIGSYGIVIRVVGRNAG